MDVTGVLASLPSSAPGRPIIGIAGPPGGGKTTLARALCDATGWAHAPGDGFIIAEAFTDDAGLHDRGAVSGFDTADYARLLAAVRAGDHDVAWPLYRHTMDGDGADETVIPASADGVVTECNFLASPTHGWPDVRASLTALIYMDESWDVCRPRLIERQLAKGRSPEEASARVDSHDRTNYDEVVAHAAAAADFTIP